METIKKIAISINGTHEFLGVATRSIFGDGCFIIFGYANGPLGWDLYMTELDYTNGQQPRASGTMQNKDATEDEQIKYARDVITCIKHGIIALEKAPEFVYVVEEFDALSGTRVGPVFKSMELASQHCDRVYNRDSKDFKTRNFEKQELCERTTLTWETFAKNECEENSKKEWQESSVMVRKLVVLNKLTEMF